MREGQIDFGLKKTPFELIVLMNDYAATPERMVGRKVAPILEDGGQFLVESMDFVAKIDALDRPSSLTGPTNPAVTDWIKESSLTLNALAMPCWASSLPEFATAEARAFFAQKKEAIIGPFFDRLAESHQLIAKTNLELTGLDPLTQSAYAINGALSTDDIRLYAHLRALSIVGGITYSHAFEAYRCSLQAVRRPMYLRREMLLKVRVSRVGKPRLLRNAGSTLDLLHLDIDFHG